MRSLTALLAASAMLLFAGVALAQEDLDAINTRDVELYQKGDRGQLASEALRTAQLAFIKQRRDDRNFEAARPYHCAAYGVTGR